LALLHATPSQRARNSKLENRKKGRMACLPGRGLDARIGWPRKPVVADAVAKLRDKGASWREIARELRVGVATARAALLGRAKNPHAGAPVSA
jgi:DNA invertase Pin-like site-specific DNA recombinase